MGYYTRYKLEIDSNFESIMRDLRESCEDVKYCMDENGDPEDHVKWYSHDKDMIDFSKKYPEVFLQKIY